MSFWYLIFVGIVFLCLIIIPLGRRWYLGCGLGLLGAILGGGAAFGLGWCYLRYVDTPAPHRDINDWSGLLVLAFWLGVLPAVGVVLGSVLGIWSAYLLGESLSNKPPRKSGPIEL
jgi:hypothetical protein